MEYYRIISKHPEHRHYADSETIQNQWEAKYSEMPKIPARNRAPSNEQPVSNVSTSKQKKVPQIKGIQGTLF